MCPDDQVSGSAEKGQQGQVEASANQTELRGHRIDLKVVGATRDLVEELLPLFTGLFGDFGAADLSERLGSSGYAVSTLMIWRRLGKPVGFVHVRVWELELEGRPLAMIRTGVGLLPECRGKTPFVSFVASEVLQYRLLNPRRTLYGFDLLTHPVSYRVVTRAMAGCMPHWDREMPEVLQTLAAELADQMGYPQVEGAHPLCRNVRVFTRQSPAEVRYWAQCTDPDVRHYLSLNPNYVKGHALVVLFPLGLGDIAGGLIRVALRGLGQRWDAAELALQEYGLVGGISEEEATRALRENPVLWGLPEAARARLGAAAERRSVPAGRFVFHQGDPADTLYLIRDGQAQVLSEQPAAGAQPGEAEVLVLDQLGPGEVFGEVALLMNSPRSAGVKAATSLDLLCVRRSVLEALFRDEPEVEAALREPMVRRLLRSRLLHSPPFRKMKREQLEAYLEDVRWRRLNLGESLTLTSPSWVAVLQGQLQVEQGESWMCWGPASIGRLEVGARLWGEETVNLATRPI